MRSLQDLYFTDRGRCFAPVYYYIYTVYILKLKSAFQQFFAAVKVLFQDFELLKTFFLKFSSKRYSAIKPQPLLVLSTLCSANALF